MNDAEKCAAILKNNPCTCKFDFKFKHRKNWFSRTYYRQLTIKNGGLYYYIISSDPVSMKYRTARYQIRMSDGKNYKQHMTPGQQLDQMEIQKLLQICFDKYA
jgi:hypothetical protein